MSAVLGVIGRLEAVAAVTALVPASRIYNGLFPQSATFPAIRVQLISDDEPMHLRGSSGVRRDRVQIDSVSASGEPVGASQAIDDAVHGNGSGSSLVGWEGEVGGVRVLSVLPAPGGLRELYDAEELRQYRVIRDVFVTWAQ